jgi:RNA polymerase sigma-70 factor (ECF subfamily)
MAAVGNATAAERYQEAGALYGAALDRLARAYEPNPDRRLDLLQEIHIALWRSLAGFDGRCSLRTWVYRVAHNTATSQVLRRRARTPTFVSLDELASMPAEGSAEEDVDQQRVMDRVLALIHALAPLDRQVILLYLEGMDASAIGEITGLSAGNVATKVHRIKKILSERFHQGGRHVE